MKKSSYYLLATASIVSIALLAMIRRDVPVEKLKKKFTNKNSKFINIDGMDVHYTDEGDGDPLVLLHGVSASLNTWDGWEKKLNGDFRIIRLDLPAFGLTGPNPKGDYSIDFYVNFMKSFLERLQVESCYMAGSSLGGYITWNFAASYPQMIKKMILLDAAGYPFVADTTPFIFKIAQSRIAPIIKGFTTRYLVGKIINDVYGDRSKVTAEVIDRYYYYALREGNRTAFLSVVKRLDFSQYHKLKTLKTPALIMWGDKDKWVRPELGKRFNEDLQHSELIMYPGVGHIPMEEIPEQTAEDARNYLLKDFVIFSENLN